MSKEKTRLSIVNLNPPQLAPPYLLKPYSGLNKSTYSMFIQTYYRNGCKQGDIINYYSKVRGRDLTVDDLSLEEALKLIHDEKFSCLMYRDISRPDIYSLCQDIIFCE